MAKNVMTEVAKALGLELGEEFSIGDTDKYVLLDDGLFKIIGELTYWQVEIENLLTGEWDVVKLPKPILTEKEKEYLSAVIKPFRDRIISIRKYKYNQDEYIGIYVKYYAETGESEMITLPLFKEGTIYKGIELKKYYTLEELGL